MGSSTPPNAKAWYSDGMATRTLKATDVALVDDTEARRYAAAVEKWAAAR